MELFVLVSAEAADPHSAAHDLFRKRYERVVDQVADRFREDVDAGLLRPDVDYASLARESIAVTDGLQLQWVLSGGRIDLVGMVRAYLERLAPGILVSCARVSLGD